MLARAGEKRASLADGMLAGFTETEFQFEGVTRPVHRRGTGPGVVVMHEMPGITPEVLGFATRLADEGFTVAMPVLFGEPGRPMTLGYDVKELARACIRHEFQVLASRRASPLTDWLRALCRELHAEIGGPGVGALGMCSTGNFALTLYVEPSVMAPVLSQPSLPFAITPGLRRSLHVSDADLATVQHRVRDEGGKVLGLRFTGDFMCPGPRFRALEDALGEGFEAIEIDSSRGNPHGISPVAHSVLTLDFVDRDGHPTKAAYERVVAFLRERLSAA